MFNASRACEITGSSFSANAAFSSTLSPLEASGTGHSGLECGWAGLAMLMDEAAGKLANTPGASRDLQGHATGAAYAVGDSEVSRPLPDESPEDYYDHFWWDKKNNRFGHCFLIKDTTVQEVSGSVVDVKAYFSHENWRSTWGDIYPIIVLNAPVHYEIIGEDDTYVRGFSGEYEWENNSGNIVNGLSMAPDMVFTFSGNAGDNGFSMTWGTSEIDFSNGGNNSVLLQGAAKHNSVTGGLGNDKIATYSGHLIADLVAGDNSVTLMAKHHGYEITADITGGTGNDSIDVRSGVAEIDLSGGGNNHVVATGGRISKLTFGSGDDFVQISGGAVAPNLMFLTCRSFDLI